MAMTNKVNVADGGGSGKKKEENKQTAVSAALSAGLEKATAQAATTSTGGGSTTHVSSSGNVHGGSSGSFGGTPNTSSSGGSDQITSTIQNGVAAAAQAAKSATEAVNYAAQVAAATPKASSGSGGTSGGGSGSSSGGGSSSSGSTAAAVQSGVTNVQTEDPELRKVYETAMATLDGMKGKAPVYSSQYDEQIRELYDQITGRQPFKYDSSTDPLYQQYRQSYIADGERAMRSAMGQAAALTGGYASSYAQSVGQQAYDRYLERLADILPETYGLALDAYNAEGDRLDKELAMTQAMEKSDYDRYLDSLNKHYKDLSLAQDEADAAYSRMIYGDETAYSRSKDYYNRLVSLMGIGYNPTAEDYAMAGITPSQGAAIRQQYLDSIAPAPSSGGGYVPPKKTDNSAADDAFMTAFTDYLNGGSAKSTTSGTVKKGTSSSSSSSSSSTTTKKKTYGNGGR